MQRKSYLVLLQLPDAQWQHSHQEERVENQNQRADPSPPFGPGTGHDGSFTLVAGYRNMLDHRTHLRDEQVR